MKYQALGEAVNAQKIACFEYDPATTTQLVVLQDGTKRIRPALHGLKPEVGDWFVETTPKPTLLRNDATYDEKPQTAILKQADFERIYAAVPEPVVPVVPDIVDQAFGHGLEIEKLGEELAGRVEATDALIFENSVGSQTVKSVEDMLNSSVVKEQLESWSKDVLSKGRLLSPDEIEAALQQSLPETATDVVDADLTPEDESNLEILLADVAAAQEASDRREVDVERWNETVDGE